MSEIKRTATGTWQGTLGDGSGSMSTTSGVLRETSFSFATRFGNEEGTNPEEMIAAAHAGCYSMALANYLHEQGHAVQEIRTRAAITLEGEKISRATLEVEGTVEGLNEEEFRKLAAEADQKCPVSNLLRPGLEISHKVALRR